MPKINILSQQLADKIAAGEVVERPAAVLKELVENSIDAGSRRIEIFIENAGQDLIEIIDDGCGMDAEDLQKSCLRHATSKISRYEDLNNIHTLGFRGEALASIAAVSLLSIVSRDSESPQALRLDLEGGRVKNSTQTARTAGTSVSVRKLFFNTPARLKFLKSKAAEIGQMLRVFQEQALAHPEIAFRLVNNREEIAACSGQDDLLSRIRSLLGDELGAALRPLSFKSAPLKMRGFVSAAGKGFASRKNQYVFVNNRCISDKTVTHAVMQAYHTHLPDKQFPAVFLFLEMPPEMVDVNVHPAKREVRFRDSGVLHELLVQAIRGALNAKQDLPEIIAKSAGRKDAAAADYTQVEFAGMGGRAADFSELFSNRPDRDVEHVCAPEAAFEKVKLLQAKRTYIIAEEDDGLTIIDQHAAHERILFDRLITQFRQKKIEKQKLLLPAIVHLDQEDFLIVKERGEVFKALGFDLEEFGHQTFAVYSYPAALGQLNIATEFVKIAAEIGDMEIAADMEENITRLLAPVACHAAIRAGEALNPQQMSALFQDLFAADAAHTCPHGRPAFIKISWIELEKKFKRR